MGRYDFRPSRVYGTTSRLLASSRLQTKPAWHDVVGSIPPSQILVRTQPVQQSTASTHKPRRKASKLFQPQPITYEEDALRRTFFADHPWELARPRVVLENDGKDYQDQDWSVLKRPGRPLNGESVVQRQLWLMRNVRGMTKSIAYDQARKEFYEQRLEEDVERRVAKEEAMAVGAYFGKSKIQIGMELEDKSYENWRQYALAENTALHQRRAAAVQSVFEAPAVESEQAQYAGVASDASTAP